MVTLLRRLNFSPKVRFLASGVIAAGAIGQNLERHSPIVIMNTFSYLQYFFLINQVNQTLIVSYIHVKVRVER
jgi:hypothetical protein